MSRLWHTDAGLRMAPSGSLPFAKKTLVGCVLGSRTHKTWGRAGLRLRPLGWGWAGGVGGILAEGHSDSIVLWHLPYNRGEARQTC